LRLALAVGILVDDATVEIENINRNLAMGKGETVQAILDGAQQIAVPAFVSTSAFVLFSSPCFSCPAWLGFYLYRSRKR